VRRVRENTGRGSREESYGDSVGLPQGGGGNERYLQRDRRIRGEGRAGARGRCGEDKVHGRFGELLLGREGCGRGEGLHVRRSEGANRRGLSQAGQGLDGRRRDRSGGRKKRLAAQ